MRKVIAVLITLGITVILLIVPWIYHSLELKILLLITT